MTEIITKRKCVLHFLANNKYWHNKIVLKDDNLNLDVIKRYIERQFKGVLINPIYTFKATGGDTYCPWYIKNANGNTEHNPEFINIIASDINSIDIHFYYDDFFGVATYGEFK